jgi:hypothetical protein
MDFRRRSSALISLVAFLGTIAGAGALTSGDTPFAMTVAPQVSFAPADLFVRTHLAPNASNRSLFVAAESEDFYRSSEMPLDAEEAPRFVTVQFRGLPMGEYSVSGEIRDADGRTLAIVRQEIMVLASSRSNRDQRGDVWLESKVMANLSHLFWQSSWPQDQRIWLAPQIYVPPTFADFTAGATPGSRRY